MRSWRSYLDAETGLIVFLVLLFAFEFLQGFERSFQSEFGEYGSMALTMSFYAWLGGFAVNRQNAKRVAPFVMGYVLIASIGAVLSAGEWTGAVLNAGDNLVPFLLLVVLPVVLLFRKY